MTRIQPETPEMHKILADVLKNPATEMERLLANLVLDQSILLDDVRERLAKILGRTDVDNDQMWSPAQAVSK